MNKYAVLLGGLVSIVSFQASATDDFNRTINNVGATNGGGYVDFKEGLSASCNFNVVNLPDSNTGAGKAMLAVLLNAQARGATLAAISYTVDANGACTANNIRSN